MSARKATKRRLIAAFSAMNRLADELYGTYQNDVQVDRAGKMNALKERVDRLAQVLRDVPLDEIEAAIRAEGLDR